MTKKNMLNLGVAFIWHPSNFFHSTSMILHPQTCILNPLSPLFQLLNSILNLQSFILNSRPLPNQTTNVPTASIISLTSMEARKLKYGWHLVSVDGFDGCLECVWRVYEGCLDDAWRVSGAFLEGVWNFLASGYKMGKRRVSGKCTKLCEQDF